MRADAHSNDHERLLATSSNVVWLRASMKHLFSIIGDCVGAMVCNACPVDKERVRMATNIVLYSQLLSSSYLLVKKLNPRLSAIAKCSLPQEWTLLNLMRMTCCSLLKADTCMWRCLTRKRVQYSSHISSQAANTSKSFQKTIDQQSA